MKKYYPLSLDIENKKCIVVGAGTVAYKKIQKLLIYKPKIEVVSKEIKSTEIAKLIKEKKIKFIQTEYNKNILDKAVLIIAATNDKNLNSQIQKDAKNKGILVNVVDDKKLCQFICPAIVEKDGLQIAITTHGQNPKKARIARETLERNFDIFNKKEIIKIGARPSPLSLTQVHEFISAFNKIKPNQIFEIIIFNTKGDCDKKSKIEQIDFHQSLDLALLNNKIDIAIHSAKDVDNIVESETKGMKNKLQILALSPCIDNHEALISPKDYTLETLPKNARVGASSRRREQFKKLRKDLTFVFIRGNINERLMLIKEKKLDAIIIAMAALKRLGLDFLASQVIPNKIMPAHPLQGYLAIQIRRDDKDLKNNLLPTFKKMDYKIYE